MNMQPQMLIVAGSDSSGGAGLVRDIETAAAFGLKSCVAITAVTAQTHQSALAVCPMEPDIVAAQMRAALEANSVKAVKIGMLASEAIVREVAKVLGEHPDIPVVLDPVLASSSGTALLDEAGRQALLEHLLPLSTIVTPNLPELVALTGVSVVDDAARFLLERGAGAVLVKGGHSSGLNADDLLFRRGMPSVSFGSKRFPFEMRGTGCMLASAIAARLAKGDCLDDAVEAAKKHLSAIFMADPRFPSCRSDFESTLRCPTAKIKETPCRHR